MPRAIVACEDLEATATFFLRFCPLFVVRSVVLKEMSSLSTSSESNAGCTAVLSALFTFMFFCRVARFGLALAVASPAGTFSGTGTISLIPSIPSANLEEVLALALEALVRLRLGPSCTVCSATDASDAAEELCSTVMKILLRGAKSSAKILTAVICVCEYEYTQFFRILSSAVSCPCLARSNTYPP